MPDGYVRFSSGVTVEGTSLFRFCLANGLKQLVKQPTREDNLLDLAISDLEGIVVLLPQISNHNMVLASFDIGIPESLVVRRSVFEYSEANWEALQDEINDFDWSSMDRLDVDEAGRYFYISHLDIVNRHIPRPDICEQTSARPWVNQKCLRKLSH